MGKKDLLQSNFYESKERFADAFNGTLFQGKQMILPTELEEADTGLVMLLESNSPEKVICDKVRKWRGKYLALLVLENQSYIDYRMVLRNMKAEIIGYEKQRKAILEEEQRKGTRFDNHEFLSGMKKEQKLTPMITLVLYMGIEKPWDGAKSLYELLDMEEELKPFVNDYKLNLYDFHEYDDFTMFQTENRVLFEVLSCAGDKEKMKQSIKNHPSWYQNLDKDSAAAISGIAGIRIELKSIKEGRYYNMCKAFDDYKEEGRLEGRLEELRNTVVMFLEEISPVSEEIFQQIEKEENREVLKRMVKTAAKSNSMEEFVQAAFCPQL